MVLALYEGIFEAGRDERVGGEEARLLQVDQDLEHGEGDGAGGIDHPRTWAVPAPAVESGPSASKAVLACRLLTILQQVAIA